jgi:hypothetical protein
LNFPIQILSERVPERPRRRRTPAPIADCLTDKLLDVKNRFSSIADQYGEETLREFTIKEWIALCSTLEAIDEIFQSFKHLIDGIRARADRA